MKCLKVRGNDSGQRLSKFIEKTFPKFPRSAIYKAIRTKKIKINRKRCLPNLILQAGDEIKIFGFSEFINETKHSEVSQLLFKGDLEIVYEDENLIVVDKPVGLNSHPCKVGDDSLISRILNYLVGTKEFVPDVENSFLPAVCNRLDTNTSGLVVAAKNYRALRCFNELLKNRKIEKTYVCLAEGVFEKKSENLKHWLQKNCKTKKAFVSKEKQPGFKLAILQYFVVEQFLDFAKIKVIPQTGRFHQIRAQLSSIGHPLVGDLKYGASSKNGKFKLRAIGLRFKTKDTMLDYLDGTKIEIDLNF